jgi:uncharacterized membrane protein
MAEVLGFIGTILFLVIVLVVVVLVLGAWLVATVIRNLGGPVPRRRREPARDPAVEQLRYRYGRGEISRAEFEEGMHALGYEKVR